MTPPAIRAVLFDKDGTLFDFFGTWMPAYEAMAWECAGGDAALAERLLRMGGWDAESGRLAPRSVLAAGSFDELASLWGETLGVTDRAGLARWFDRYCRTQGALHAKPVTDLVALFRRLKGRGLRLGLATMDSHAAAEDHMAAFGLAELLDFVCGYDTGHGVKPGPGMVEAFCRAVALPAPAVAVVGDTPHDLAMARAAGAGLAVGVLTGASPPESLAPEADHVLASIADLERVLDGGG